MLPLEDPIREKVFRHPSAGGKEFYPMAFLGDAILEVFLRKRLLRLYPEDLKKSTRERAVLASTRTLAYIARSLHLDRHLIHRTEELSDYLMASLLEAYIAGIFMQYGQEKVEEFLEDILWSRRDFFLEKFDDFVGKLKSEVEDYHFQVVREGKQYRVSLIVDGKVVYTVRDRSKREAIYRLAKLYFTGEDVLRYEESDSNNGDR